MLTSKYACELCVPSLSPALCQRRSPLGLNALAARVLMQAVSLSFRPLLPVSVGRSRFRRQSKHLGPSCKSTLPKPFATGCPSSSTTRSSVSLFRARVRSHSNNSMHAQAGGALTSHNLILAHILIAWQAIPCARFWYLPSLPRKHAKLSSGTQSRAPVCLGRLRLSTQTSDSVGYFMYI